MLRLQFTAEDLLCTRFASGPAPLLELVLAFAMLQRRDPVFDHWRHDVSPRLPSAARLLFQLVPSTGTGPTFLDPVSHGLEDGLDTVLSAPQPLVRGELRRVWSGGHPITPWARALGERDAGAWRQLASAVRSGYDSVLPESWARVWQSFRADVAWRGRLAAEQGLRTLLTSLHPGGRWRGNTLEFDVDSRLTVRLAGRGLTLMPSAFWTGRPMVTTHPDGSVLVVYASVTPLPFVDGRPGEDSLADLLGRTRAAVLCLAVGGRTTGDIARELGISAASASEHARTLRNAGLLVSQRCGKAVVHSATPLGDRLFAESAHLPRYESPPMVPTPAAATSSSR